MKQIQKIKEYSWAITLVLVVIIFFKQCGANSDIDKLQKQAKKQSSYMDSLCTKEELKKIVEIEGLKAEKRMIQSTDRKMLDVNRQSEIDLLIKKHENSK